MLPDPANLKRGAPGRRPGAPEIDKGETVIPRNRLPFRPLLGAVLAACVTALPLASGPSRAEELSREQQIADLEKQIKELTKKLEDLRKAPAPPAPQPAEGIPADWVKALTWRCIG